KKWDAQRDVCQNILVQHSEPVYSDRLLVTDSFDKAINIWGIAVNNCKLYLIVMML
ncbi:unnamed protein product, partial [Rotaria magnacalcarata]